MAGDALGDRDDAVGVFPDAAGAFRDICVIGTVGVHVEVVVGAVAKRLRAARYEIGEPGVNCSGVDVVFWL